MKEGATPFSSREIERLKSDTFVRAVESFRELPSTNDLALERANLESLDTPLLVLTEIQTAGRGRGGNQWWAARGALTFSLVIDINDLGLSESGDSKLSLTTGLAVSDAVQELLPHHDIRLKWPNDIYLDSRKVSGILLERTSMSPNRVVVGIGVNVNNSLAGAPNEVRALATSLHDATEMDFSMYEVLRSVLKRLEIRYRMLSADDPQLPKDWSDRCYLRDRIVVVETGDRSIRGQCQGIDDQGALLIQDESGVSRLFTGIVHSIE